MDTETTNGSSTPTPRFTVGQVVMTRGALAALKAAGQRPEVFLARHLAGDWGEVDADDWAANEAALLQDERLLSAYTTCTGQRLWLITEWDRSATTMLLPDEY